MILQQTDLVADALRPGDDGYDAAARTFFATGAAGAGGPAPRAGRGRGGAGARRARTDLAVSVRSGGHSPLGHSTNTGGMVIDLAHLDAVEILDAERRLVRVGGGATWGRVAAALDPLRLGASPPATPPTSASAGSPSGGGIGWMVRRYGLAIDNLVGARVVTADGRLLTTSEDEHPDLFWALRGGGGNFGVVVDFDFVAQPVGTVHFGTVTYRLDDPADLLARWRDAMRGAPEELSSTLALPPPTPAGAAVGGRAALLRRRAGHHGGRGRRRDRAAVRAGHGDRRRRSPSAGTPRSSRTPQPPPAPAAGHPQHPRRRRWTTP